MIFRETDTAAFTMKTGLITCMLMLLMLCSLPARSADVDSLIARLDSTLISESQIDLQLQIARAISNTDIRKALEYAHSALKDAEEIRSTRWIAESKLAIGQFYDYLGVNREAANQLMEAFSDFRVLGDSVKQATTLMHIGNAFFYLDQFETAQDYYTLVSEYGRALNDTSLIISGLNATAEVFGNIGNRDSALILFNEAFALSKEIGSLQQEIQAYYNIGDVHLYSGRRTQALKVFHALEDYYDLKTNSSKFLSNLYNSMTKAYLEKRDIEMARHYSELSLEALNENMRLTEYMKYYLNLFRIDTIEGNSDTALFNFIRYKELSDSLSNASFKEQLANFGIFFELQSKENEIERLTLDNQFKDLKIRQKKLTNYLYVSLSSLMLVIVFLLIRSYRQIKKKNVMLERQKEALETTQQQLVQSEKMASIGTLTAGIAHEINNPLNFISGGLTIVKGVGRKLDWTGLDDDKHRFDMATKMAQDGLDRSVDIVKALMTFSHRGGSKKVETDLHEIIDNTLMFLSSKISEDIRIIKHYNLDMRVPVFPEKMHQVVMNILDNAIFAVNVSSSGPKSITITTRKKKDKLILTFTNSGPSIKEEHLARLFDPFFTTKDPGQGTGLGLSICYTLVSEHGGEIQAENIQDGVLFRVSLPTK
ncbi:MAG: GHKL domain-containing protein [Bacteroidia bacterium]|nr:MAG: GHKL domain-containing protein [Bacteroidia bacterium]